MAVLVPASGWKTVNPVIRKVSKLTFGIYLLHYRIIRYVLWDCSFINRCNSFELKTFIIAVSAFLISLAISFSLSLLPGARYLVGERPATNAMTKK